MHFLQRRPSGDYSAPTARAGRIAATAALLLATCWLGTDDAAARGFGFGGFGGFHNAGQSRYHTAAPSNRRNAAPQHFNNKAARRNTHVAAPRHTAAATRHWHQAKQYRHVGTHAGNKVGTASGTQATNKVGTNNATPLNNANNSQVVRNTSLSKTALSNTTAGKTNTTAPNPNGTMHTYSNEFSTPPSKPTVITSNINSPAVLTKNPGKLVLSTTNNTSPVATTTSTTKPVVTGSNTPPAMTPSRPPQTPGTGQTGTNYPPPTTTPSRPPQSPSPTQTATNTPNYNSNIYVPPRPPPSNGYPPRPPRPPHPPIHGLPLPLPGGPVLASVPPTDGGIAPPPPPGPPTLRSNGPPGGGAAPPPPSNVATNNGPFVPDEILVRFTGNTAPGAIATFTRDQRLALLGTYSLPLINTVLYQFRITDGRAVPVVLAGLQGDGRIATSQPNFLYNLQDNVSRPASDLDQYAVEKLHLTQAHDLATGSGVLIAVIDTAIDAAQPDMQGSIVAQYDAVKTPLVPLEHGTEMAGAIVAHGRLVGVAPGAHILAVRAFDASSAGGHATTTRLLDSLQWASTSEARIVSMSFAGPADPGLQQMIAALHRKGVVLVAAAGNNGPHAQPAYPAAYPGVIAVTATDIDDHLLGLANRGSYVAVAAPGVDVMAAQTNGKYNFSTGTSIACAHVSGIAALMLQRNPQLTPDALTAALMKTAKDLGPKGRDEQFGAGLVDAYEAVLSQAPAVAQGGAPQLRP